jgi:hypothetical protein
MENQKSIEITHNNLPSAVGHVWEAVSIIRGKIDEISDKIKTNSIDELMTPKEVARMFKCCDGTVNNWTAKGKLIKHCIGNRTYYKRSEVESALIPIR